MKKRIQELAKGKFDTKVPDISVSAEKIQLETARGTDAVGDFVLTGSNHVKMRGIVYSSHPRMVCLTPQFEGEQAKISYQFHSDGLEAGDCVEGCFTVLCNGRERSVPFTVQILAESLTCSNGRLVDLAAFTRFAATNYEEAYHLFYSRKFRLLLKEGKDRLRHELLRSQPPSVQKFEEFLVTTGQKEELVLSLSEEHATYYGVRQAEEGDLTLHKSTWGHCEITVYSDAGFLLPERKRLLSDDFLGNDCKFSYKVDPAHLHAGRNYGKIHICTSGQHLICEVMATWQEGEHCGRIGKKCRIDRKKAELTGIYIDFRLKKKVTGEWTSQSVDLLQNLSAEEPENKMWKLMQAQALLLNRQRQEASWILNEYKRGSGDRNTAEWAYYLYLSTLMEPELSYVDRLTAEIEKIFEEYPTDPVLFWILLFLREEYYSSPQKRLAALREWILSGSRSPFFYLEVYDLWCQDPQLLTEPDAFTIEVLCWAARHGAMTKEIAAAFTELLPEKKDYDKRICLILEKCRQISTSDELILAGCAYLIRWQKFEHCYHVWYQEGVEREVRVTNLYEAFLLSMDLADTEIAPKPVLLYFQYNNSAPYRYLAMLYANVAAAKKEHPDLYRLCEKAMKEFALGQLMQEHIDDNLALLYREFSEDELMQEGRAKKAAEALFTHKLCCNHKQICAAYILHEQIAGIQAVPVVNGVGFFRAYTKDYAVMLLDTDGNCYVNPGYYLDEEIFSGSEYREKCLTLASGEWHCVLSSFAEKGWQMENGAAQYRILKDCQAVSTKFRRTLLLQEIRWERQSGKTICTGCDLQSTEIEALPAAERTYVMEQMLLQGRSGEVYPILKKVGTESFEPDFLERICSLKLAECGERQDDFLIFLAMTCFEVGKRTEPMLRYLAKYYNGPTEQMKRIWHVADIQRAETYDLEERILTQVLYGAGDLSKTEAVYRRYCLKKTDPLLCEAYVSCTAYAYLGKDRAMSQMVTATLWNKYVQGSLYQDVNRIALLKELTTQEELTREELQAEEVLLREYLLSNRMFAFYKNIDATLLRKYHLYDRTFLEYTAEAERTLRIRWRRGEEAPQTEELTEQFEGIYGISWILFTGERITYEIEEYTEGSWKKLDDGVCSPVEDVRNQAGRYGRVEQIEKSIADGEIFRRNDLLEDYRRESDIAGKLFHLM